MPSQAAAASTAMVPQAHPLFWEVGGEGEQWPTHGAAPRERITHGVESDQGLTDPSANWQLLGTWAQSHSEGSPDPYGRPYTVRWQALLPGKKNLKHDRTQGELGPDGEGRFSIVKGSTLSAGCAHVSTHGP